MNTPLPVWGNETRQLLPALLLERPWIRNKIQAAEQTQTSSSNSTASDPPSSNPSTTVSEFHTVIFMQQRV